MVRQVLSGAPNTNDSSRNRCYSPSVNIWKVSSGYPNVDSNPEVVVRLLSRGIIRRVLQDHPESTTAELRELLDAASPFKETDSVLENLWHEEIELALRSNSLTVH